MAEIKLGPQDDDEQTPEELQAVVEQLYILEVMAPPNVDITYGPMTRRKAIYLAGEMLVTVQGALAIRLEPIQPWDMEE